MAEKSEEKPPIVLTPQEAPLWVQAWTAVSNANDCKSSATSANWADSMIRAIRLRTPS